LSSAIFDSVGSFGVFYFDNKKRIDFAYSTASDISFKKKVNSKTKTRQLYFRKNSGNECIIHFKKDCRLELRSTLNADCFEFGLLDLAIGTPFQDDKKLMHFLKNYFKRVGSDDEVVLDFVDYLNTIDDNIQDDSNIAISGNSNIFLINIDLK
jgi:hypothetical protein